ncbi:cytochrome c oxidase assembly protein COX18, mitochondrial-like [Lineus longissimus]|uniref:cytochrome c oxidase assembly protein COX18, mitochondrial-like n=1 Tax=Lineus longissimus TaxID=88925 RepID=UPI00315D3F59
MSGILLYRSVSKTVCPRSSITLSLLPQRCKCECHSLQKKQFSSLSGHRKSNSPASKPSAMFAESGILSSYTSVPSASILDSGQQSTYFQLKRNISGEFYQKYLSQESPPIAFLQDLLEQVHSVTGLPWWASIVWSTFLLRTVVTLPAAIYSQKVIVRVELLQPEIIKLTKRLKGEVAMATKQFKWKQNFARFKYNSTMKKLISELYIRDNCHPFKASLVLWLQIPMWIGMSFALRNMTGYVPFRGVDAAVLCPDLATEGLLWFSNLTLPDTTFILPVVLGLLNFAIIEMNVLVRQNPSKFQRVLTGVMRGLSILMVPIGASVPSCMCLYWTTSSFYGLLQNIAFKMPKVKRTLGIPLSPSESSTPFQDMIILAKEKYKWLPKSIGKD